MQRRINHNSPKKGVAVTINTNVKNKPNPINEKNATCRINNRFAIV
jgi:hypothetical protein